MAPQAKERGGGLATSVTSSCAFMEPTRVHLHLQFKKTNAHQCGGRLLAAVLRAAWYEENRTEQKLACLLLFGSSQCPDSTPEPVDCFLQLTRRMYLQVTACGLTAQPSPPLHLIISNFSIQQMEINSATSSPTEN